MLKQHWALAHALTTTTTKVSYVPQAHYTSIVNDFAGMNELLVRAIL